MVLFYKKIVFFLLSTTTLFLLVGCSPVGEEVGDVSGSSSSSETGDGFCLGNQTSPTAELTPDFTVVGFFPQNR